MNKTNQTAVAEIFTSAQCGWAQRNYAALLEKEADFDLVPSKTVDGEKTNEFLALSPLAKTPVLSHGDVVVWESTLINEYIEDAFPGRSLMPETADARAAARCSIHYCDNVLSPTVGQLVKNGEPASRETLGVFETWVSSNILTSKDSEYWGGHELMLVDLAYSTLFQSMDYAETQGISIYEHLPARVRRWAEAIASHASVKHAADLAAEFRQEPRILEVRAS